MIDRDNIETPDEIDEIDIPLPDPEEEAEDIPQPKEEGNAETDEHDWVGGHTLDNEDPRMPREPEE